MGIHCRAAGAQPQGALSSIPPQTHPAPCLAATRAAPPWPSLENVGRPPSGQRREQRGMRVRFAAALLARCVGCGNGKRRAKSARRWSGDWLRCRGAGAALEMAGHQRRSLAPSPKAVRRSPRAPGMVGRFGWSGRSCLVGRFGRSGRSGRAGGTVVGVSRSVGRAASQVGRRARWGERVAGRVGSGEWVGRVGSGGLAGSGGRGAAETLG